MALVVETGVGLSNADAYVSVADTDARVASVGQTTNSWTGAGTSAKELAIRQATQLINRRYDARWTGRRKTQTQALAWPRTYAYDSNGYFRSDAEVPVEVKNATADLAVRCLTTNFDEPASSLSGDVIKDFVKVGPIEVEQDFSSAGASTRYQFNATDEVLAPVLASSGNSLWRM